MIDAQKESRVRDALDAVVFMTPFIFLQIYLMCFLHTTLNKISSLA